MRRVKIIVMGRVQGVFFRASTLHVAERLGLVGFVRNLPDGSVEIEAQGQDGAVRELYEWAKHGPPSANVDTCTLSELSVNASLKDFLVR